MDYCLKTSMPEESNINNVAPLMHKEHFNNEYKSDNVLVGAAFLYVYYSCERQEDVCGTDVKG